MATPTIVSDPEVMMGKPVVILEKLAAGEKVEDILAAHPGLTAEALRADVVYPVSGG